MHVETLVINGYRNMEVPTRFILQDASARQLAIIFPGLMYTCDGPLLYFATSALLNRGVDVLQLECSYGRRQDYSGCSPEEQARWLVEDAVAAVEGALRRQPYERIWLIGKSLGTITMGHLLTTDKKLRDARAIWLTPLFGNATLREQLLRLRQRSLLVIGTGDRHYDADAVSSMITSNGAEALIVEGADHGMEVPGQVIESIRVLERVIRGLEMFLESDPI